jgi:hypothetical protein
VASSRSCRACSWPRRRAPPPPPPLCKESYAHSLRGGGGELGNLKTLTYGFTIFEQR